MDSKIAPVFCDADTMQEHLETCAQKTSACAACVLAKKFDMWMRHLSNVPWLAFARHRDGSFGVGCALCARAAHKSAYGEFEVSALELRLSTLRRHEQSKQHLSAWRQAADLTGIPGPPVTQDIDAPPAEVFQAALDARLSGIACHAGLPKLHIGPDKLQQLSFCLTEAKRMLLRTWFVDQADTVALQQDERHQRLLLRFTAASLNLERRSGVLGLAKNFGSAAGSISEATGSIIRKFCTLGWGAPGASKTRDLQPNQDVLQALTSKVEVYVADAASDEQKAGTLMRAGIDGQRALLPNLKLGLRDSAHATRRRLVIN